MKRLIIKFLLLTLTGLLQHLSSGAQNNSLSYILPDNNAITVKKLDSLVKAWGGEDRIMLSHNAEDDAKHQVHLVRVTDEMKQKMAEDRLKRQAAANEKLNHGAASWTAKDINGKTWSLDNLKGKVVVLNFWFTACSPCVREMPDLNKVAKKYAGKNVVFVALSFDTDDMVRSFLKKHAFDFVHIANSKDINKQYGVEAWPTSVVLDKSGNIKLITNFDENIVGVLSKAIDASI